MLRISFLAWVCCLSLSAGAQNQELPRFYEIIDDINSLETDKHYLLVAKYQSTTTQKPYAAYNGYNATSSLGLAGEVVPSDHQYPIVNINLSENTAKPILLEYNQSSHGWLMRDGVTGYYLGANSDTSGSSEAQNLVYSPTNPQTSLFNWQFSYEFDENDDTYYWFVRNQGKGEGNYYLKYDKNGNGLFRVYRGKTIEDMQNIYQVYKQLDSVNVAVGFTGYGTLYYSSDNLLVANKPNKQVVMAHTCHLSGMQLTYNNNYADFDVIPMNHAVVVTGEPSTNYHFFITRNTNTADAGNILKGRDTQGLTTADNDGENYLFYKLTTRGAVEGIDNNTTGFYWGVPDGLPFEIPAHKAYLALRESVAQGIQAFLLDFAEDHVVMLDAGNASEEHRPVYDLQGRKMDRTEGLPKGIYIVQGRKMVIR